MWGSNRAGKTLVSAVEFARAVSNRDPYKKYPAENGRAYIVGKDGKHLAETVFRKLLKPGAFRIIRDTLTNQWRSYRPWEYRDVERVALSRPAPSLIPERLCPRSTIAWYDKKLEQPSVTRFSTGWETMWYSAEAKPPQGGDIDIGWFDEEITDPAWYTEIAARLLDRKGIFYWSAAPQAGTEQLWDLHLRAEDQTGQESPKVTEHHMKLADNPHVDKAQKDLLRGKYSNDPAQYQVRIEGEFAILGYRFFPNFSEHTHGIDPFPIPNEWTRYLVIDPGHQVCAVLFIAVPPPTADRWGGHKIVYDELYIEQCTAAILGQRLGQKMSGQQFEAFIIDPKIARHTETGSGLNVEAQYSAALKANSVSSIRTGSGFLWASNDFDGGIEAVRGWLAPEEDGLPMVLYLRGAVPQFRRNMERYHKKKVNGVLTDKPVKKHDHQCDNLRYLAMHGCPYRKPKPGVGRENYAYAAVQRKLKDKRKREGGRGPVNLGPGG